MSSLTADLAALLNEVDRPGDFCTCGVTELLAPNLVVDGVGPIALPVLPAQAQALVAAAERAPYGRGPDTIIDPAVRNSWQIGPERLHIGGRHWPRTLEAILAQIAEGLGVRDPIEAELYKLLIYEPGSFFISHRDTEKSSGMFATLVIALPSESAGGELIVRHRNREITCGLRADDPGEVAFAAFYADCVHEVRPVTAGHRLTLIYNLIRRGKGHAPQPPEYGKQQTRAAALLRAWGTGQQEADDDVPIKLVYPLAHAYTQTDLAFHTLKGTDAAAAGVLAAAADQSDCALYLALLTVEESGSAEYSDNYSGRRSWSRHDDVDDQYEVGEIDTRSITLSDWRTRDGSPASWGETPVISDELSPPDPFAEMEPDELHFQEASGNAGVSFERSYRRAALVVWPNSQTLAVLTQAGLAVSIPHLGDLARRWRAAGGDKGSPFWQQAHELAGRVIRTWQPQRGYGRAETTQSNAAQMLTVLAELEDPEQIESFLTRVTLAGDFRKSDNQAMLAALLRLPPSTALRLIEKIVATTAPRRFAVCADLLARAASTALQRHGPGLRAAGQRLIGAIPGGPAREPERDWSYPADTIDAGFVADLLVGLGAIDPVLAERATAHVLGWPKTYDLDAVVVPAAVALVQSVAGEVAVEQLRLACLAHLDGRIAEPLAPPADWRRSSAVGCRCPFCSELSHFLADPTRKSWSLRAREADRAHVAGTIRTAACDVDTDTVTTGRPYSLVCTKNQASYQRRVMQRGKDLENVRLLRN
jgi:hypothetical protein